MLPVLQKNEESATPRSCLRACNAVSGIKLERMWGLDTWTLSWFLFLIVGDFIIIIM